MKLVLDDLALTNLIAVKNAQLQLAHMAELRGLSSFAKWVYSKAAESEEQIALEVRMRGGMWQPNAVSAVSCWNKADDHDSAFAFMEKLSHEDQELVRKAVQGL